MSLHNQIRQGVIMDGLRITDHVIECLAIGNHGLQQRVLVETLEDI